MKIGTCDLDQEVFIVAEVGNNHEGDFDLARKMVELAAACGVHAVKFQTIHADTFVSPANEQRFKQLKKFELSDAQFAELAHLAKSCGIYFMSTPFDLRSVDMLDPLVPAFKIASGDNDFFPLLEKVAKTGKPLVISTGLQELDEARRTKQFVEGVWQRENIRQELALLHCVSSYPTPPEQAALQAIAALRGAVGGMVGYSDHTLGIEAAVLSVALGARLIEKHFTIDKNHSTFRDHQLSADPVEMRALVARVREASLMLGELKKEPQEAEKNSTVAIRRSIVAGRSLPAGHRISLADLGWMRPGDGLRPGQESLLLDATTSRAIECGEKILESDVTRPDDN